MAEAAGKFRLIPAPAGNTGTTCWILSVPPAHPRACGEHNSMGRKSLFLIGSSPRLRGTRNKFLTTKTPTRLIPAPAGNTNVSMRRVLLLAAHPRACGEHMSVQYWYLAIFGSSPRLRGTHAGGLPVVRLNRLIPAPAGNTCDVPTRPWPFSAHPRACGEHNEILVDDTHAAGSSPRLRGTRTISHQQRHHMRLIPAPAGNTPTIPD